MIDLNILKLNLSRMDDAAKRAEGWLWYQKLYLGNAESEHVGIHDLHDGEKALFHDRTFDHAFYKSSNYQLYPKRKDVIDVSRLERVRWISAVISGQVEHSSCWEVVPLNGRPGIPNRVYIAHAFSYLVFLEPRAGGKSDTQWRFSSAYSTTPAYIKSSVKGNCIWTND